MRHGVRGYRDGGVAERHEAEQGAARTACALKWGGASAARHREAAARQQGSEVTVAAQRALARCAQVPARAQSREGRVSEGEREEREKGSGERNKSQRFDLVQTRNFQLKLEKF